jgi:hypothetical protein
MAANTSKEHFGCERCWPPVADAAWEARSASACVEELIDESHFHVMILACAGCNQRFVSVFAETVDWADSEDPQYWTLLPVTEAEALDLVEQGDSLTETKLRSVGSGRRCLRRDFPKGAEAPRSYWLTGMSIGPHD